MLLQGSSEENNYNYDKLKITTITMVFLLETHINVLDVFHLLPVTKINLNVTKKMTTKKFKLPKSDIVGAILSIRHENITRGIIRNAKFFKNAVSIDISTSIKNINVKLLCNKIHLCGATSIENGLEAATLIIDHIKRIKSYMDYLRAHVAEYYAILNWLTRATKGEPTIKTSSNQLICQDNYVLNVIMEHPDFSLHVPEHIPNEFNHDVVHYLLSLMTDLNYHGDYINKMRNMLKFKHVYTSPDIKILKINEVMVNYNYNLGFKINRDKLHRLIDGNNGFISNYDNAVINHVPIELNYESPDVKRKKSKIPHHTFLVYHSGAVTLSGANIRLIKEAYILFMRTIHDMKDEIIYTDE